MKPQYTPLGTETSNLSTIGFLF